MNNIVQHIARFAGLLLLQVLVLNQWLLFGWATPMLYPLFVLLLPITLPLGVQLILAFLMGVSVDAFSQTGGMHAAALVFMTYLRPAVLGLLTPKEGYQADDRPTIAGLGLSWFLFYAGLALLVHHLVFYLVEVLSIVHWQYLLLRFACSWLLSLGLAVLAIYVTYPRSDKRTL